MDLDLVTNGLVAVGLLLQAAVVIYLVRGPFSRYFPLFLFVLYSAAYWVAGTYAFRTYGLRSEEYRAIYYNGEILQDLLQFFLVITLTVRAMEGTPVRDQVVKFMGAVMAAVIAIPFLFFSSEPFSPNWYRSASQLLNFGAVLMNLALWSALVMTRRYDRQLMIVSAGVGLQVAGAALALGVKRLTNGQGTLFEVTDWVYRITQVISPAIWCYAFRTPNRTGETPAAIATPSTT